MKIRLYLCLLATLSLLLAALPSPVGQATPALSAAPAELLQFTSGGHALGFSEHGMYAGAGNHMLHVDFPGAKHVQPQAEKPVSLTGNMMPLRRVTYTGLWDGIDLTYTATPGTIFTTYYHLAPGADAQSIRLRYHAPLSVNGDGSLRIAFEGGVYSESAPIAWQETQGKRIPVKVAFRVRGQEVSFALGKYDPHYPLTIDPGVTWNTFLGGGANDLSSAIAVDGNGNVYVTGISEATWDSPVHPYTPGAVRNAFVAKLNSSGVLQWHTFLGGLNTTEGQSIAVDSSGYVYVMGWSQAAWSCDTPCTVRGFSGVSPVPDAFIAKLNQSDGVLVKNTFLGGTANDYGYGLTLDGDGNVYVTGNSAGAWSCIADCTKRAYGGPGQNAFVAKLSSDLVLTWNTFLGGSGGTRYDQGWGVAVDDSHNVYVIGYSKDTWSCSYPCITVSPYQGDYDAFAARLDSSGVLIWNTFMGGPYTDYGYAIAVYGGNLYVTGQVSPGGPLKAVVGRLVAETGATSTYTLLGGSDNTVGRGIVVNANGIYVTGWSRATWGDPMRPYTNPGADGFAARLGLDTLELIGNVFLGGSGEDADYGIAVKDNDVYLAGTGTTSWGDPKRGYTGNQDAFVVRVNLRGWNFLPLVLRN